MRILTIQKKLFFRCLHGPFRPVTAVESKKWEKIQFMITREVVERQTFQRVFCNPLILSAQWLNILAKNEDFILASHLFLSAPGVPSMNQPRRTVSKLKENSKTNLFTQIHTFCVCMYKAMCIYTFNVNIIGWKATDVTMQKENNFSPFLVFDTNSTELLNYWHFPKLVSQHLLQISCFVISF